MDEQPKAEGNPLEDAAAAMSEGLNGTSVELNPHIQYRQQLDREIQS